MDEHDVIAEVLSRLKIKHGRYYITDDGLRSVQSSTITIGKTQPVHRFIAEQALGRPLRGEECVHHADGNHLNNDPENLVICPDNAYHKLLHARMNAQPLSKFYNKYEVNSIRFSINHLLFKQEGYVFRGEEVIETVGDVKRAMLRLRGEI